MADQLETDRTLLRPFRTSDTVAAFKWFSDPEVMRYIPYGPDTTIEQTARRISKYIDHQHAHGFSKWLILDRYSGTPMGDAGFFLLPDGARVELGYRLSRPYWGHGLAMEVATQWLNVARKWFGFTTVYAFAHPENNASLHIIQRLGFEYLQTEHIYEMEVPLYSLYLADMPHATW